MKPHHTYMMGGAPQRLYFKPSRQALTLMRQSYTMHEDWRARASEQARIYARWIADRDGIELPPVSASTGFICNWEGNRIQSVTFTHGRRSSTWHSSKSTFIHERKIVTIELPNWDFTPSCRQLATHETPSAACQQLEAVL